MHAEAAGCGLPVLISDKVNIWREIESSNAGVVRSDTAHGTLELLQKWQSMTSPERSAMSIAAMGLFQRSFTVDAMARELEEVVRPHSTSLPS